MKKRYLLAGLLLNTVNLSAQQPAPNLRLGRFDGQFAPVMVNQERQWLHISGAVMVDKTENFGLYNTVVAVKHNAYGAINSAGKIIAPFKFDGISVENEKDDKDTAKNYCLVITQLNGKYGAVDTLGNIISEPVYSEMNVVTTRVAAVKKDGRWGWIAISNGAVLQAPLYEAADKSYVREHTLQIKKGGKVGLAAEDGAIIVPAEYDSFEYLNSQDRYFGFTVNGKSGVMDRNGKIVVPAAYERCSMNAGNDLFSVVAKGKTGFVNAQGKELLPLQYTAVAELGDAVKVSVGNKNGVVNAEGKEIIPAQYDDIKAINAAGQEAFRNLVPSGADKTVCFLVKQQDKIAVFDPAGKQLSPFIYSEVTPFSRYDTPFLAVARDGKAGVLRPDGKVAVPPVYEGIAAGYLSNYSYVEEEAGADKADFMPVLKGEGLGLFNMATGKEVLPPVYNWIQWQNGEFLFLRNGDSTAITDKTGKFIRAAKKYGFFTSVGNNRIVETQYQDDGTMRTMLSDLEGRVLYTNKYWDFKDERTSRLLIPENERRSSRIQFRDGLLKVWGAPKENLFLDEAGKEVIFDEYTFVGDFWNGLAIAGKETGERQMLYGIINRKKEIVYPVTAGDFNAFGDYLLVKKDTARGLIRKNGTIIFPVSYDDISVVNDAPFYSVSQHHLYGITDSLGNVILPPVYDEINYRKEVQLFELTKAGKQGWADVSGKIVIPVIYDEMELNRGYDNNIFPLLVKEGKWYFYVGRDGKPFQYRSLKKMGYND
ncbi:WG repeat-containing protein [Chitinophaga arvensicola]|uniref:WG containing repeat-containing protein n=1 Tax=Chitinophaga arvensicola TaxID=29529 RepID=A0A1I0S6L8_9BACT|nr:WG repeat-containing protein [Chitinophaga arvensicola]SEW51169.1 WG containing repeat-containing protein [Chitinophaga arvensicola]